MDREKVKFMYVRDPECEERVVTLARVLDGDKMRVAWCVNKVTERHEYVDGGTWETRKYTVEVHDKFNKKVAREIVLGRLFCERDPARFVEVPLEPEVSYALQTIRAVRDSDAPVVSSVLWRSHYADAGASF